MKFKAMISKVFDVGSEAAAATSTCVHYAGRCLPPASLRGPRPELTDNRFYFDAAREEAGRLIKYGGLTPESRVLDMGCGSGRLALGILEVMGQIRRYEGIDVDDHAIEWCQLWITTDRPVFAFTHVEMANDLRLPFPDATFDVIRFDPVCVGMKFRDNRLIINEIHRLLAPEGCALFSDNVQDESPLGPGETLAKAA